MVCVRRARALLLFRNRFRRWIETLRVVRGGTGPPTGRRARAHALNETHFTGLEIAGKGRGVKPTSSGRRCRARRRGGASHPAHTRRAALGRVGPVVRAICRHTQRWPPARLRPPRPWRTRRRPPRWSRSHFQMSLPLARPRRRTRSRVAQRRAVAACPYGMPSRTRPARSGLVRPATLRLTTTTDGAQTSS